MINNDNDEDEDEDEDEEAEVDGWSKEGDGRMVPVVWYYLVQGFSNTCRH